MTDVSETWNLLQNIGTSNPVYQQILKNHQEMQDIIKQKRYNKFKDDSTCSFTFDQNLICQEWGWDSNVGYRFANYE